MTDAQRATEEGVRALAAWASALPFDAIPEGVRKRAVMVIADDLACAVGSRDEPEVQALKQRLPVGSQEATVFLGDGTKTDRASAAMINAIAANWCQLDEGHRQVMCHAGLYVVPAAIAEAEATAKTLRDMLRATVIGYEIVCRFAQTFRFGVPTAHPHAMWSALGAAAAVAALRGFDAARFADAMTAAATMAAGGPFAHAVEGALIANAWAGLGVANGFRCVDLTECGIAGLSSSPFAVFASVLGAETDSAALTAGLGERWALDGGYHKVHSCAQQSHAAVEAMLRLTEKWPAGKSTREIVRILVEVHSLVLTMDNRNPPTTLAARFSVPHIVAAVATFRRADAAAFANATLEDAEIARLRNLIELKLRKPTLAPPYDRAARVTMVFNDGTTFVEECLSAEGGPDRPLSAAQVLAKCKPLTRGVYPKFAHAIQGFQTADKLLLDRCTTALVTELCSG